MTIDLGATSIVLRRDLKETEAFLHQRDHYEVHDAAEAQLPGSGSHRMDEVPEDLYILQPKAKDQSWRRVLSPILEMCKHSKVEALVAFLGMAGISALWYIVVYMQTFFTDKLGISSKTAAFLAILAQLVPLILTPFAGLLTDMIGVGRVMLYGNVSMFVAVPVFVFLVHYQTVVAAYVATLILAVVQGLAGATYAPSSS